MSRSLRVRLVVVLVVVLGLGTPGCSGTRTLLRGQSPEADAGKAGPVRTSMTDR
jgi:hypothetical protein